MSILIEVLISVLLIVYGYCSAYNYLHDNKWFMIDRKMLCMSRNKAIYLTAGIVIAGLLIVFFQAVYHQRILTQIKLISLPLFILPCGVVDFKVHKIPNVIILSAFVFRVCLFVIEFVDSSSRAISVLKDCLLGCLVVGGFFLLMFFAFKNSIGMGDVKLFAIIGLFQGLWGAINSVFFSLLVSFFVSLYVLITKKKKKKDVIAFGPSILLGTIIAISISGM